MGQAIKDLHESDGGVEQWSSNAGSNVCPRQLLPWEAGIGAKQNVCPGQTF